MYLLIDEIGGRLDQIKPSEERKNYDDHALKESACMLERKCVGFYIDLEKNDHNGGATRAE